MSRTRTPPAGAATYSVHSGVALISSATVGPVSCAMSRSSDGPKLLHVQATRNSRRPIRARKGVVVHNVLRPTKIVLLSGQQDDVVGLSGISVVKACEDGNTANIGENVAIVEFFSTW